MPFLSASDPAFWDNCPEPLRHLQEATRKVYPAPGDVAFFALGEIKDNPPSIACLRLAPGQTLPRHRHDCDRFEIIVSGSLETGEGWLQPGDVMTSAPGVPYGPHVAGPDGCTTFEIFSNYRALHCPQLETRNGPVVFDVSTPQGLQNYMDAAGRESASTTAEPRWHVTPHGAD